LSRARQELFVDYGRWYWASLRPKQLAVKHAAEAHDVLLEELYNW
jgi:hypothetical protein